MDRATEIRLLKRTAPLPRHQDDRMADAPWRNDVTAYTCPERHKREEEILIRNRPLVMGLSCDWPKPGAYRTDDFAGVPILTVRAATETCAPSSMSAGIAAPRWPRDAAARARSRAPITAGPTATTERCAGFPRRQRPSRASGPSVRPHPAAARREVRHGVGAADARRRPLGAISTSTRGSTAWAPTSRSGSSTATTSTIGTCTTRR